MPSASVPRDLGDFEIEQTSEDLRQQRMIEDHNRTYAVLRADPVRWQAELAERRILNGTLADGLEHA